MKDKLASTLQKQLRKISGSILCFLHYNDVPPDNNGSERAIRNIFIFDNPSNLLVAYLLFFLINAYLVYLLLITELNARWFLRACKLGYGLPSIVLLLLIYSTSRKYSDQVVLNNQILKEKGFTQKNLADKLDKRLSELWKIRQ